MSRFQIGTPLKNAVLHQTRNWLSCSIIRISCITVIVFSASAKAEVFRFGQSEAKVSQTVIASVHRFGEPKAPKEQPAKAAKAKTGGVNVAKQSGGVLGAIHMVADRYNRDPRLKAVKMSPSDWRVFFQAMVKVESNYKIRARSHVGAIGLAQLMPGTAQYLRVDPHDPIQNLDGGARYLLEQMATFRSPTLALAAYNAGPAAVQKYGGVPPYKETRKHIVRVFAEYERLKQAL